MSTASRMNVEDVPHGEPNGKETSSKRAMGKGANIDLVPITVHVDATARGKRIDLCGAW